MKKALLFALLLPITAQAMDKPVKLDTTSTLLGAIQQKLQISIMYGKFKTAKKIINKNPWIVGMLIGDKTYPTFGIRYEALDPYFLTVAWWISPTDNQMLNQLRARIQKDGDINELLTEMLKAMAHNDIEINQTFNKAFLKEDRNPLLLGALDLNGNPIKWYDMFKNMFPQCIFDCVKK